MKKTFLLLIPIFFLTHAFMYAQKPCKITVTWSFEGVKDGYDHDNKVVAFIDGEQVGESSVKKESESNSYMFEVKKGRHEIRVVNMAQYEGEWEEHTVANEYSLDCLFEDTLEFKKKCSITLVFDIDKEETSSIVKNK
jgi:hypothetical protein